jgi:hypothetical protein
MDQVHRRRHPRLVRIHDALSPALRPDRPRPRLLDRIRRPRPASLDGRRILRHAPRPPRALPRARPGVEVLPPDVRPAVVPRRAGSAKVQCAGLQAEAGAVSKGDQEGAGCAADAAESRVCV